MTTSRKRLKNVERKNRRNKDLEIEYEKIIHEQLEQGIVEKPPEKPTGSHVFYMPYKPVVREEATTTKVRMVLDTSAKPHPLANSFNKCMYPGPTIQPLFCDIMIRARISTHLLLVDLKNALFTDKD